MVISIAAIAVVVFKIITLAAFGSFLFILVCWPIGDQPTTKTQYGIWAILMVLLVDLTFIGIIQYGF